MRIAIRKGRSRWIVEDGITGENIERFSTFHDAAEFAHAHIQRRAVKRLMREVVDVPDEWHGLDLALVPGSTIERKLGTLRTAAAYRGHRIATATEDDAVYVRYVPRPRRSLYRQIDDLDKHTSLDHMQAWERGDTNGSR